MFIERVPTQRDIRRAYDVWSLCYDLVAAPWEDGPRRRALGALHGRRILDVGIGSGAFFADIIRASPGAFVCGAELSHAMARRARRRLQRRRLRAAGLLEASALRLPFAPASFDLVASSYVLDLMSTQAIVAALRQFHRVLQPGGRAVLVNLTKFADERTTRYERCYRLLPTAAQAYLLGGCRPVQIAPLLKAVGFIEVERQVVRQFLSSEIVIARKPFLDRELPSAA